jgi:hypothetical protein
MENVVDLKVARRFWQKVDKQGENECWNWIGAKSGYRYGSFSIHSYTQIKAHRLSWLIHFGDIPKGMLVCHKCDNSLCVNPKHLFLGTTTDNMRDMTRKGRHANMAGEHNPRAKLCNEDIIEIKEKYESGKFKQKELANLYGIVQTGISCIILGKTWKNVK